MHVSRHIVEERKWYIFHTHCLWRGGHISSVSKGGMRSGGCRNRCESKIIQERTKQLCSRWAELGEKRITATRDCIKASLDNILYARTASRCSQPPAG